MTLELILKYLSVIGSSAFRFTLGPIGGYLLKIPLPATVILTVIGMMCTVITLSLLGKKVRPYFRRFSPPGPLHTPKNRRKVRLWRRYGMWGVAFLTPIVLSPIGGTLIAVSFGEKVSRILYTMLIAGIFWSIIFSIVVYTLGEEILRWVGR